MFDDDIDYNAVFEVETEPETGSGAEDQEAAAPEADEETEGEEEQEIAAPAEDTGDDETPDDTGAEEQDSSDAKKPKGKKDSVYAAARRRAEAEMNAKLDEIINGYNWTDPYTGQQIKSKAEYDAYLEKFQEEKNKKVRESAGMSEKEFDDYIDSLPAVKAAKAAQAQAQETQIQQQIAGELKQISALDPSIHTVSDVLSGENGEQIRQHIARGMTMLDAFKLANFDRLRNGAAEDERRHAGYNAASKAHLTQSKSRGQGMTMVPKDTMEMYRAFNPGMTDAEIQKDYNNFLNGG